MHTVWYITYAYSDVNKDIIVDLPTLWVPRQPTTRKSC